MLQLRGRPVGPGGPPHAHSAADDLEEGRILPGLSAPASGRWPFEVAPSRWRPASSSAVAPPRLASSVERRRRVAPTVAPRVAGLRSQKSTGKVWRDEVYEAGRYGIGPDYTFRCYPLNVQNFNERLSVWSKSSGSDAGSTVYLDVSYQYLLKPEKLGELYSMVALNFEGLVASRTQDAIRNTAPLFGIDSYLSQRPLIEATLQRNVSLAIADLHMDVLSFQLRDIEPEDDYQSARLAVAIQVESNAKEAYSQEATLVREQTAVEVLEIENDADAVAKKATASASKIKENAVTEADEKVEVARLQGLKLCANQNFTARSC